MSLKFIETVERMKRATGLRTDTELARALDVTPGAISNFRKRGEIPTDLVISLSVKFKLSVDWLLTGEGEMKRESPLMVAEARVLYNAGDADLSEICEWLRKNPVDKKLVLKVVKAKKGLKEALDEFVGVKGVEE